MRPPSYEVSSDKAFLRSDYSILSSLMVILLSFSSSTRQGQMAKSFLAVIAIAPDIFMFYRRHLLLFDYGLSVAAGFKDGFYALIRISPYMNSPAAGRFQSFRRKLFAQAYYAQAGTIRLLRMWPARKNVFYK